ncbi:MAG: protein translocase subunit SecF [archaeon]|nr:protein translocase subunit SecF [archaeon]
MSIVMIMEKIMDYIVGNPKKMLMVSLLLLAACMLFLGCKYMQTGEIVERSIDFKSGTQAVIEYRGDIDVGDATQLVHDKYGTTARVRILSGMTKTMVIETDKDVTKEEVGEIANALNIDVVGQSMQSIGAALGEAFWRQALSAIAVAFLAMAIVVFITFRSPVPSLAVILAGVSDIVAALVGMNLLGIQLSMGTLAGLLILMGYSIDTDILLSTRVIKRRGEDTLDERIKSSMKTGITMSTTSIIAMLVLFMVSSSPALDDIALVIIMGLLADIPFTWLQNVGILRIHMERMGK